MGLAFDEWDLDYYTAMFRDEMKRDPTNVELFDIAQSNSEHSRWAAPCTLRAWVGRGGVRQAVSVGGGAVDDVASCDLRADAFLSCRPLVALVPLLTHPQTRTHTHLHSTPAPPRSPPRAHPTPTPAGTGSSRPTCGWMGS